MTQNEELKPCPFCGCEAHSFRDQSEDFPMFYAECMRPRCNVSTRGYGSEEEAVAAWNTRPSYLRCER